MWCVAQLMAVLLSLSLSASVAAKNADYNVSKGLAPNVDQSVQVLKAFHGEFRILGLKFYQDDEQAKFSPVDLAVSSGIFTDPRIAAQITISQYNRYLKWSIPYLPIPAKQAMELVSNIHIIPGSPEIAKQIKALQRGDLVHLQGELVEIKDKDLVWRSSLSRDDVGDGACEVFRVNRIQWLESNPHI